MEESIEEFVAGLRPYIRYQVQLCNRATFKQAVAEAETVRQLIADPQLISVTVTISVTQKQKTTRLIELTFFSQLHFNDLSYPRVPRYLKIL